MNIRVNVRVNAREEEEAAVNMMCGMSRIYCDSHSRDTWKVHDGEGYT